MEFYDRWLEIRGLFIGHTKIDNFFVTKCQYKLVEREQPMVE